ncbi:MAG: DUF4920 domain-containing protein [Planctomycetes bacterium]|nr:DUF4920 domain-containing protein [Planctomycetota bacterium]
MNLRISLTGPGCLFIAAAGCASPPALPDGECIGAEFRPAAVHRLAELDRQPSAFYDRTVLVEARIEAVCQKVGCWMKLVDGDSEALVRWEAGCGGAFTFPKDAAGKRVIVQGSYYPKEIAPADIEHLREEAGGAVSIPARTHELNVSAILVIAP